jgi:hypothetical protein
MRPLSQVLKTLWQAKILPCSSSVIISFKKVYCKDSCPKMLASRFRKGVFMTLFDLQHAGFNAYSKNHIGLQNFRYD